MAPSFVIKVFSDIVCPILLVEHRPAIIKTMMLNNAMRTIFFFDIFFFSAIIHLLLVFIYIKKITILRWYIKSKFTLCSSS